MYVQYQTKRVIKDGVIVEILDRMKYGDVITMLVQQTLKSLLKSWLSRPP